MAVDQPTSLLLEQMASAGGPPFEQLTPAEARQLGGALLAMYGPGPSVGAISSNLIPTREGPLPVQIFTPETPSRAVIVYLHGGGWVMGALDQYETLMRQLVVGTSCTVVLVDYRLAPEHPYPAAVNDTVAAVEWAAEATTDLAGQNVPVLVMGDSAGANLAAVAVQRACRSGPDISLQVLVYPITDCNFDTESYRDPENQLVLTRESMKWFWDHYAPNAADRLDPATSPLRAPDLSGLPPTVIVTAENDVLRDEGEAYAQRLRDAGVPVQSRRFAGQMHLFFTLVNLLPGAADGMDYVCSQIAQHLDRLSAASSPDGAFELGASNSRRQRSQT